MMPANRSGPLRNLCANSSESFGSITMLNTNDRWLTSERNYARLLKIGITTKLGARFQSTHYRDHNFQVQCDMRAAPLEHRSTVGNPVGSEGIPGRTSNPKILGQCGSVAPFKSPDANGWLVSRWSRRFERFDRSPLRASPRRRLVAPARSIAWKVESGYSD
jgi:hypothetical protein